MAKIPYKKLIKVTPNQIKFAKNDDLALVNSFDAAGFEATDFAGMGYIEFDIPSNLEFTFEDNKPQLKMVKGK